MCHNRCTTSSSRERCYLCDPCEDVYKVLESCCGRRLSSLCAVPRTARSARPLLAELCRGVCSTSPLSGILKFHFRCHRHDRCFLAATQSELSQQTSFFTNSATEHARQSVASCDLDDIGRMQPVLESTIARMSPDRHRLPHPRLGPR